MTTSTPTLAVADAEQKIRELSTLLVRQGGQMLTMKAEIERLRTALIAIRDGTISGNVGGEDVVWFDEITTLHDFCDGIIAKATGASETQP